jgi:hypothetical protein
VKLPHKKNTVDRVIGAAEDSVDHVGSIRQGVAKLDLGKHLGAALPDGARAAGLIAGGLVGLTAGSAGISSYRRRRAGANGHP